MTEKYEAYSGSPFCDFGQPYVFIALSNVSDDEFAVERFVLLLESREKNAKIFLRCLRTKTRNKLSAASSSFNPEALYEGEKRFAEEDILLLLREHIGDKAFTYKANLYPINVLSLSVACTLNPELLKILNQILESTNCSSLSRFIRDAINLRLEVVIEKPIG